MTPRDSLITALADVWKVHPHWRFGQVVANVAAWAGGERPGEIGEVSDEAMLEAAREHLRQQRLPGNTAKSA